jgi:hypothetical protein
MNAVTTNPNRMNAVTTNPAMAPIFSSCAASVYDESGPSPWTGPTKKSKKRDRSQ